MNYGREPGNRLRGASETSSEDSTNTIVTDANGDTYMDNPNKRPAEITPDGPNEKNPRTDVPALPNSPDTTQDKTTMDSQPAPLTSRSITTSNTQQGNGGKHRAIMPMYSTPRWQGPLQDRDVVRLPLKIYFSINELDRDSPVVLKFQLNEYWRQFRNCPDLVNQTFNSAKILVQESSSNPAAGTADVRTTGALNVNNRNKGLSRDMAYDQMVNDAGVLIPKPVNTNALEARQFSRTTPCFTAGTSTTTGAGKIGTEFGDIQPDYRNFYEEMYQVRHVHGCAWKLTLQNASASDTSEAVVYHKTETITTANDSVNQNLQTNQSLQDVVSWPSLQSKVIKGDYTVVQGLWRSDQSNKQHDVIDSEEIKEWYPTGSASINAGEYEEFETLMFYAGPNTFHYPCFNAFLEIDYLVEYRDLKRPYRNVSRSSENTAKLGITGTLADLYPHFPKPTAGTNWPTRLQLSGQELTHAGQSWGTINGVSAH